MSLDARVVSTNVSSAKPRCGPTLRQSRRRRPTLPRSCSAAYRSFAPSSRTSSTPVRSARRSSASASEWPACDANSSLAALCTRWPVIRVWPCVQDAPYFTSRSEGPRPRPATCICENFVFRRREREGRHVHTFVHVVTLHRHMHLAF